MSARGFNLPTNLKFKKFQRKLTYRTVKKSNFIFSNFVEDVVFLKSLTSGRLNTNVLEAARKIIRRKIKKLGLLVIHTYPYVSTTKKPLAVRMGKGKGAVDKWVFPIRPGQIIFEIKSSVIKSSIDALVMASKKLPIKVKIFAYKKHYIT